MKPGHAFTIEPMISEGKLNTSTLKDSLYNVSLYLGIWHDQTWPDNWTAVTQDGKLSAQFEQTMVVTDKGVEVLTARPGKRHVPYFMEQK